MSTGPQLVPPVEPRERNWMPLAIAAAAVLIVAAIAVFIMQRGKEAVTVTPISAAPDPYATSLPITSVVMSESSNLAGGKVTYIDGHITNTGNKTVSGVSAQVLFRNVAKEVAQNETQQLKWIRTRDPYVDLEPASAAPLKPGDSRNFRMIFDSVTPDWNGVYPEIRIVHIDAK
ncbi:MAG: DUF2393 family protein [Terracidiphilus sp.]